MACSRVNFASHYLNKFATYIVSLVLNGIQVKNNKTGNARMT
jgi:hypothetical protein